MTLEEARQLKQGTKVIVPTESYTFGYLNSQEIMVLYSAKGGTALHIIPELVEILVKPREEIDESPSKVSNTDPDWVKLRSLAIWLDVLDKKRDAVEDDEVQRDLRRIANNLEGEQKPKQESEH